MKFTVEYVFGTSGALQKVEGVRKHDGVEASDSGRSSSGKTQENSSPHQWAWAVGKSTFDWMDHHGPFDLSE